MSETIVLDPSAVATGRTEFDITGLIQSAGVDWGDAEISAYMAEAISGQVPVDYRVPNRTITIPLVIKPITGLTYDQARQKMQAKVGLIHREGGWLKRVVSGTPLYADVVNATLKLGGSALQSLRSFDIDATLSLECLPEFYGDEITLDNMTETSAAELLQVLKLSASNAVVRGDYPGRVRIVVDEDQGVAQRGLLYGFRSRYYSSATTAALAYQAEALTPLDTAAIAGVPGASGGTTAASTATTTNLSTSLTVVTPTTGWANGMAVTGTGIPVNTTIVSGAGTATMVMSNPATASGSGVAIAGAGSNVLRHGSLGTSWTPVLSTTILSGTANMTHQGTYRVWARCYSASTVPPDLRLVWTVADDVAPTENAAQPIPAANFFYLRDLGEIRLDAAPAGTHQWRGAIQARGGSGGENVAIDKVWFQPVDESAAQFATALSLELGFGTYSARTEFVGGAAALTGTTLTTGQTWTAATGSDTTDFNLDGAGQATRTAVSDTGTLAARILTAGTTSLTAVVAQVDLKTSSIDAGAEQGIEVRASSTGDGLRAYFNGTDVIVEMWVSGAILWSQTTSVGVGSPDYWYSLRLHADAAGRWMVWFTPQGNGFGTALAQGIDATLATGGTLASGRVALYDSQVPATAATRTYDNFSAWVPTPDAVVFASQSSELRTDGCIRESNAGGSYRSLIPVGDLPRLPPSGIESRTVELLLKMSRGDLDTSPDTGIDDLSAQVFYRPCWLFVPGA